MEKCSKKLNNTELLEEVILKTIYNLSCNSLRYVPLRLLRKNLEIKDKHMFILIKLFKEGYIYINGSYDFLLSEKGIERIKDYVESINELRRKKVS